MEEWLKKATQENLQRLVNRIKELEAKAKAQQDLIERLKIGADTNLCWWDGKQCRRQSEISGLQSCGRACAECHRLDGKDLSETLERVLASQVLFTDIQVKANIEEAESKSNDEGQGEAWREMYEELLGIMGEAAIEPVDPKSLKK